MSAHMIPLCSNQECLLMLSHKQIRMDESWSYNLPEINAQCSQQPNEGWGWTGDLWATLRWLCFGPLSLKKWCCWSRQGLGLGIFEGKNLCCGASFMDIQGLGADFSSKVWNLTAWTAITATCEMHISGNPNGPMKQHNELEYKW